MRGAEKGAKLKSHDILMTARGADMKRECGNSMREKRRMNALKMRNNVFLSSSQREKGEKNGKGQLESGF